MWQKHSLATRPSRKPYLAQRRFNRVSSRARFWFFIISEKRVRGGSKMVRAETVFFLVWFRFIIKEINHSNHNKWLLASINVWADNIRGAAVLLSVSHSVLHLQHWLIHKMDEIYCIKHEKCSSNVHLSSDSWQTSNVTFQIYVALTCCDFTKNSSVSCQMSPFKYRCLSHVICQLSLVTLISTLCIRRPFSGPTRG